MAKKYTAFWFAGKIANLMRKSDNVPRDTGLLQTRSINALELTPSLSVVAIGGEKGALAHYAPFLEFNATVGNTNIPNRHQGWTAKMIENEIIPYLKSLGD